jgi:glycosyltransferase involved in cell wall biosynthesis
LSRESPKEPTFKSHFVATRYSIGIRLFEVASDYVRICLISPHHVSFQPRTLREADTLAAAGHDVRVVSKQTDATLREHDQKVMESRIWRLQTVSLHRDGSSSHKWMIEAARTKVFERLFQVGLRTESIAASAYIRGLRATVKLTSAEKADWFIAHTQSALPIAVTAAKRWNAKVGFDCEDLLAEMNGEPRELVRSIERTYLSQCDYVSVPSESIAARLVEQYRIQAPVVLYNVFPLKLAETLVNPGQRRASNVLRLHWFGQTIGEGRGLEEAIEGARLLGARVQLHLRGRVSGEYRSHLESLARQDGASVELNFHPIIRHDELIKTMDQFDVGLALESPGNGGYARTVTNKFFSYMLAGLAIAATDTRGQHEAMSQALGAGFLYPAGAPHVLAEKLRHWIDDPHSLRVAQQTSWNAARQRFSWEIEKTKFLSLLN